MVTAQVLEATHAIDDGVGRVGDRVLEVDDKVDQVKRSLSSCICITVQTQASS